MPADNLERMMNEIRNLLTKGQAAETKEEFALVVGKALHRLDRLETRIKRSRQDQGRKGGLKTAERGPDYFKQIAAMRKTRGGGRPKKEI